MTISNRNLVKMKKDSLSWTVYVMNAVAQAKKSNQVVILEVGKESSGKLLQDALLKLALSGEEAAWMVDIKVHTHLN